MNKFQHYLLLIILTALAGAATTETVIIPASKMDKTPNAIIVLPDSYNPSGNARFPVIYLLHGWSGAFNDWSGKTDLGVLADKYKVIIVCPDGGYAGWYLDSPIDPQNQYATYIAGDVVSFVDEHYRSDPKMSSRALCGLSMGGHGAISLLAGFPDIFAAAGSISGVMDLSYSTQRFGIVKILGSEEENKQRWNEFSCLSVVEKLAGKSKAILIDCGIDDTFIPGNREIHQKLIALHINHDYVERPGSHSWDYWTSALEYHLLFFEKHRQ